MEIKDAVILVTGASSGIGAATARAASEAGAKLVLVARRKDRIQALADELGESVAIACDVTETRQVNHVVHAALDAFGRIDVLLNIAGQGLQGGIDEIAPEDFRAILDLNLVAPLVAIQAVLPAMRKQGGGSIVNVSSGITFSDLPETGGYSASKAALNKLSAIARIELADENISVSTMYPFITRTNFSRSLRGGRASAARLEANHAPEPHEPETVARAILDLIRSGAEQADLVPERFGGTYMSSPSTGAEGAPASTSEAVRADGA